MKSLKLKNDIYWLGSLDPKLRVFDIIMETEFGTTYNSYFVKGSEKTAVFETVKERCFDDYIKKLEELTDVSKLDYIVVSHTEPDHAGSIAKLLDYAKNAKIVASERAVEFLKDIMNREFDYIIANHLDELSLGNKSLQFYSVPFLHWPDTIYTYIKEDKTLITCDSFGSHYSFDEVLYSKIPADKMEDYKSALRYYYLAIFSPFKPYVLEAIEKIKAIYKDIDMVLPGHGPVLDKNPQEIMKIYEEWSQLPVKSEKKSIVIPYVAAYGYTEQLAQEIELGIKKYDENIETLLYNINIANFAALKPEVMKKIDNATGVLFGTSTINGDALPLISDLAQSMGPIAHAGKYASAFGSYGWSGEGVDNIIDRLDQIRLNVLDGYKIKFKPNEEKLNGAFEFGYTFAKSMSEKLETHRMRRVDGDFINVEGFRSWKCTVCGEVYDLENPPLVCPACGVGREFFIGVEKEVYAEKDFHEKVVIIGGGVAGLNVAESIRKYSKNARIEIIEAEKSIPYYRTMLSEHLYKTLCGDNLYLKPYTWFEENDIDLRIGTGVKSIDFDKKEILMLDGEISKYDKLVLANGARANIPKIQNYSLNGVFSLRTKEDAEQIKAYSKTAKKAIVLGGGVLGLEAAFAMKECGLDVSVIEIMQRILPRQLDENASAILEEKIKNYGIHVYKNSTVRSFEGTDKVEQIVLGHGTTLDADLIIISAGIVPNKDLVEELGIKCNRGVIVNDTMETSIKDVYACGDIAEYNGKVIGLWDTAIDQAKIVAANIVGIDKAFNEKKQPLIFEGMDTKVISIGKIHYDTPVCDALEEIEHCEANYKKLFFENGKVSGGIIIGDISKGADLIKATRGEIEKKSILRALYS
ncbi:MAG: FAD-dependent oxidoreductase [Fusobacteriaceae bacterium]